MTTRDQLPAPSGLGAVLSIVQAVVALVPRWLVVATGVIFLTWLGLELFQKSQQVVLQTETMAAQKAKAEAESRAATMQIPTHAQVRALAERLRVERGQKPEERREY
jgi:peroxiredoxin family protein